MKITCYVLVALLCVCSGCGRGHSLTLDDGSTWGRSHPDFHFFHTGKAVVIASSQFGVVLDKYEAEALMRLAHSPAIELTPADAKSLLGRDIAQGEGKLIMLRAIAINGRREGFSIHWRDGIVRVNQTAHVHGAPKAAYRRAVIASLPDIPTDVFIDFSIAD